MARYYWKMRSYGDVAVEACVFTTFVYLNTFDSGRKLAPMTY